MKTLRTASETCATCFAIFSLLPFLCSVQAGTLPLTAEDTASNPDQFDAQTNPDNPVRKLFGGERLDLWSLRRPVATASNQDGSAKSAADIVDSLIAVKLSQVGEAPPTRPPSADARTLIRRLSFNLTGLPPAYEEVRDFEQDSDPRAYERLVEHYLTSPHYGERQARWWLDVVRYADTHGYERDEYRPLIWKYRDYVVRAFNENKPYDQFVIEQLAGDELYPSAQPDSAAPDETGSPDETAAALDKAATDARIATGYLRLGQWDSTAEIFDEKDRLQAEQLADVTNTTAAAFLGLTMSCCQCHDHKYDPLSHEDHYRFRAFFASMKPVDDEIMAVCDSATDVPAIHVLSQGDFQSPLAEVEPGFVSVLAPGPAAVTSTSEGTTGRRLALAKWIADPRNPWTARVFVNRIWQLHFGTGLVATPNDFGYSGMRPTHPELLDWLAVEFIRSGWDIRHLHRTILLSQTFRQASIGQTSIQQTAGTSAGDNVNSLRQNVRRLDAETLRDSLLKVSGLLKPVAGGKPRWPAVPEELTHAQPAILEAIKNDDGGRMQGWYTDPVDDTDVRSLYLVRKRCLPIPFLQVFDLPDSTTSCARRDSTIVAPQALTLLNSPESVRYVEGLASSIDQEVPQEEFASRAEKLAIRCFERALARRPEASELEAMTTFLKEQNQILVDHGQLDANLRALQHLCRAVVNSNEFCYLD